jgi:predicted amidohydrolase YtcJ
VSLLITGAQVEGRVADVRVVDGTISELGPDLRRRPGEETLEVTGGEVLPGLHDHHLHLRSWAASAGSVPAGPPATLTVDQLRSRLRAASGGSGDHWVRATGYDDSVAGPLDRHRLDDLVPGGPPIRVQHRSGGLWMVNSTAVERLGLDGVDLPGVERHHGRPTGRLWRLDGWLAERIPTGSPDLGPLVRHALAHGVTGWTDADPGSDRSAASAVARLVAGEALAPRLYLMGPLDAEPPGGGASLGPVKVMLDDDRLPGLDELTDRVAAAHRRHRPVAVHCVTAVQLAVTLAALEGAGPMDGDRIEHGADIPTEAMAPLRGTGAVVVTQPNFVAERGDQYRREVPMGEWSHLWRVGSLRRAGIPVAGGTDAPFGDPDPWAAMRAAVDRRTPDGEVLGPDERVDPRVARDLFLGPPDRPDRPRRLAVGSVADLCVLGPAYPASPTGLEADRVVATVLGGRVAHRRAAM